VNIFIAFLDCMDVVKNEWMICLWMWLEMKKLMQWQVNVKNINKNIKLVTIIFVTISNYKQKLVMKSFIT